MTLNRLFQGILHITTWWICLWSYIHLFVFTYSDNKASKLLKFNAVLEEGWWKCWIKCALMKNVKRGKNLLDCPLKNITRVASVVWRVPGYFYLFILYISWKVLDSLFYGIIIEYKFWKILNKIEKIWNCNGKSSRLDSSRSREIMGNIESWDKWKLHGKDFKIYVVHGEIKENFIPLIV